MYHSVTDLRLNKLVLKLNILLLIAKLFNVTIIALRAQESIQEKMDFRRNFKIDFESDRLWDTLYIARVMMGKKN